MSKKEPTNRLGKVPIAHRPDRDKWQLTIRKDGKRIRSLHDTEEKALTAWRSHCKRLERHGTQGDAISRDEGREYLEAKRIVGNQDLRQVAAFWRQHHPESGVESTVSDAWERFAAEKLSNGLSKRHRDTLKYHIDKFVLIRSSRQIRSITSEEVRSWLADLPFEARTVANHKGSLAIFFNWCRRRKLIESSPVEDIHETDLPTVRPKPKGVLTVDQCAAMLAYLERKAPQHVPWHVLQLFAGIRRAEADRMAWSMIDLKAQVITLPASIVKTGDDWALHDLPSNLWKWLERHQSSGQIAAPSHKTNIRYHATAFPKLSAPIPSWPQNAMRHTFCTMMMSLHGDAVKVATWSRHTNTAQLYKSYVAKLVSKVEAERFVGIVPM